MPVYYWYRLEYVMRYDGKTNVLSITVYGAIRPVAHHDAKKTAGRAMVDVGNVMIQEKGVYRSCATPSDI